MTAVPRPRPARLRVEPLEARAVPATLVNPQTVTYADFDGDLVTVRLTRPVLTAANLDTVFTFDPVSVAGDNTAPQQLRKIDLTTLSAAQGTGVSVTAAPTRPNGDGLAHIGAIDATGLDLGAVAVRGDLGRLLAGDATTRTPGLGSLAAVSMGRFGTDTQGGGDLVSRVAGGIGSIRIDADLAGTEWHTTGGADGAVGSLAVGGNLTGSFEAAGRIGDIRVGGNLGAFLVSKGSTRGLRVGGDVADGEVAIYGSAPVVEVGGSLIGGDTLWKGKIFVDGAVGRLTIGGDVLGGAGNTTGFIRVNGPVGSLAVGGDLVGAGGPASAQIYLPNTVGSVRIGGDIWGGAEENSGALFIDRAVGSLTVGGDVVGGTGRLSGRFYTPARVGTLTVGGSLIGGSNFVAGLIQVDGGVSRLTVAGDVVGGAGERSAQVAIAGRSGTVRIGGNVRGGGGPVSGAVFVQRTDRVEVGGDVVGGGGDAAGWVSINGPTGQTRIGGDVIGGTGASSGKVNTDYPVGSFAVAGDLVGGAGRDTGTAFVAGPVSTATVGGSVRGGSGLASGQLWVVGRAGSVTVAGDVVGGTATAADQDLGGSGSIRLGTTADRLTVGGSVYGGSSGGFTGVNLLGTGMIHSGGAFGTVHIRGSLVGRDERARLVAAGGLVGIGRLAIGGRVENADILAGYRYTGSALNATNADTGIGAVTVGGDWVASNLLVGVDLATGDRIGNDSFPQYARLGPVTIGGHLRGTAATGDAYLIAAEVVGPIVVAGVSIGPLAAGPGNDLITGIGPFADVTIKEVAP